MHNSFHGGTLISSQNEPSDKDPLLLCEIPLVEHNIVERLKGYELPAAFSTFSEAEYGEYSPGRLLSFVIRGGVGGSSFGPLRRGWAGVIRVFLACALALGAIQKLIFLTQTKGLGEFQEEYTEGNYKPVRQTLAWLEKELKRELKDKTSNDHIELPPGNVLTPWKPKLVHYQTPFTEPRWERWKPRTREDVMGKDEVDYVFLPPPAEHKEKKTQDDNAPPSTHPASKSQGSPEPITIPSTPSETEGQDRTGMCISTVTLRELM